MLCTEKNSQSGSAEGNVDCGNLSREVSEGSWRPFLGYFRQRISLFYCPCPENLPEKLNLKNSGLTYLVEEVSGQCNMSPWNGYYR